MRNGPMRVFVIDWKTLVRLRPVFEMNATNWSDA